MIRQLLLDFLFPPTCPHCGSPVHRQGEWCTACFQSVLSVRQIPNELLQSLDAAWILTHYTGGIKTIVYDVKFNAKKEQSKGAVPFLRCFDFYIDSHAVDLNPHLVIPIPTSKQNLNKRGYNQVDLLFRDWVLEKRNRDNDETRSKNQVINQKRNQYFEEEEKQNSSEKQIQVNTSMQRYWSWCDCLHKIDTGKEMWNLTGSERRKNVAEAFIMKSMYRNELFFSNYDVLLVDDIYTTGATLEAAAQIIRAYHPRTIKALTLASGAY